MGIKQKSLQSSPIKIVPYISQTIYSAFFADVGVFTYIEHTRRLLLEKTPTAVISPKKEAPGINQTLACMSREPDWTRTNDLPD